jgi:hypothetical protein
MYFCGLKQVQLSTTIRRIISIVLIGVFAISITPAILLHNLFSDHVDTKVHHNHTLTSEVSTAGVDCHCESFVAETNFLYAIPSLGIEPLEAPASVYVVHSNQSFYTQHHFYAELRGPPAFQS